MKAFFQILKLSFTYRSTAVLIVVFNILFVIFNLLSLVLFVPFLKLIFDPENIEETAAVVTRPDWETKANLFEYFSQYYNWWMADFVEKEGDIGALTFICITVLIAFFLKNFFFKISSRISF